MSLSDTIRWLFHDLNSLFRRRLLAGTFSWFVVKLFIRWWTGSSKNTWYVWELHDILTCLVQRIEEPGCFNDLWFLANRFSWCRWCVVNVFVGWFLGWFRRLSVNSAVSFNFVLCLFLLLRNQRKMCQSEFTTVASCIVFVSIPVAENYCNTTRVRLELIVWMWHPNSSFQRAAQHKIFVKSRRAALLTLVTLRRLSSWGSHPSSRWKVEFSGAVGCSSSKPRHFQPEVGWITNPDACLNFQPCSWKLLLCWLKNTKHLIGIK